MNTAIRKAAGVGRKRWLWILVAGAGVLAYAATASMGANAEKNEADLMTVLEGDVEVLNPFTLETFVAESPAGAQVSPNTDLPAVPTLREWVRVPYRPPVRSPFVPSTYLLY